MWLNRNLRSTIQSIVLINERKTFFYRLSVEKLLTVSHNFVIVLVNYELSTEGAFHMSGQWLIKTVDQFLNRTRRLSESGRVYGLAALSF